MKKFMFVWTLVAFVPIVSVEANEYNSSQTAYYAKSPSAKTGTYKRVSSSRKTGGYNNVITNNFYYGQPTQYKSVNVENTGEVRGNNSKSVRTDTSTRINNDSTKNVKKSGYYKSTKKQTSVNKRSYSSQERKFFLAHPFFQPLQGHVGSVTDFSYARNSFNFDLFEGRVIGLDPAVSAEYLEPLAIDIPGIGGKAETKQFVVKEDLSYGLTDTLALVLMAQYDKTKVTFKDWSEGEGSDSRSDSGLNIFGIGLQNRFVDNDNWIAMAEAYFQHQKDVANTLMASLKAGYKIDRTTLYGIGRVAYTNLIKNDRYGTYVDDSTGDWLMLSYKTNVKDVIFAEGGVGAFAVLSKYFTLNGEVIYGYYDWHNQLNVKGAFGWQPADMFALNLYASAVLYDSAKGKIRRYMNYDVDPELPAGFTSSVVFVDGDYKIKDYNEWKIGVQAILHF